MTKRNAVFWAEQFGESFAAVVGLAVLGAAWTATARYVFAVLIPDHIEQFRIGLSHRDE